jgi:hypothetical protein
MLMLFEILAGVGAVGTAAGWLFAWRSRGEALAARGDANAAGERARMAEVKSAAMEQQALDAESRAAVAVIQYKSTATDLEITQQDLLRERILRGDLLDKLAKLGAPVGDELLDSTIRRLYENRHRPGNANSPSPGAGGDLSGVPSDPAKPPAATGKS